MTDQVGPINKRAIRSFKASSLKLDPSLIAIACHLARIAAEKDYDSFKNGEIPYTAPEQKGVRS